MSVMYLLEVDRELCQVKINKIPTWLSPCLLLTNLAKAEGTLEASSIPAGV